jgi:polygalacturonase
MPSPTAVISSPAHSSVATDVVVEAQPQGLRTADIQRAIDTCAARGGGRVILRAGQYCSGTVFLKTGVTLHLEKGAVLLGSAHVADYDLSRSFEGAARVGNGVATALVFAENADRVSITGEGVIDGNGEAFWMKNESPADWIEARKPMGMWIPGFGTSTRPRPRALVLLVGCHDVRIEGVTLRWSPAWTLHLLACTRVVVRGMTLRGAVHGSNTDGVDLDACSDVLVEDCDIETGDDAMCLKNTNTWGLRRPSRHITVRRCRLASTTHGFTIGTETQSDFEDISLFDSRIEKSGEWRTMTGIGLSVFDGGDIRGVVVRNVTVSDSIAPIQLRLGNVGRGQTTASPVPGSISGLLLERVTILRAHGNCLIAGLPGHPLRDVALRHVSLEFDDKVDPALIMSSLPEFDTEFPPAEVWRFLPAHGFYCRHVDGLEFTEVTVTVVQPDRRPALILNDIAGLEMKAVGLIP